MCLLQPRVLYLIPYTCGGLVTPWMGDLTVHTPLGWEASLVVKLTLFFEDRKLFVKSDLGTNKLNLRLKMKWKEKHLANNFNSWEGKPSPHRGRLLQRSTENLWESKAKARLGPWETCPAGPGGGSAQPAWKHGQHVCPLEPAPWEPDQHSAACPHRGRPGEGFQGHFRFSLFLF